MTTEEREREIWRVEKALPRQPHDREGALRICEERGLLGGEVIVYKADYYYNGVTEMREQAVRCRCSACGDEWFASKLAGGCCRCGSLGVGFLNGAEQIGHGDDLLCPTCGAQVKAVHVSYFGAAARYTVSNAFFLTVENVGGHLAVLEWWAERTTDKLAAIRTDVYRHEATVVIGGKCERFVGHQRLIGGRETWYTRWEHRQKYFDNSASCRASALIPFPADVVTGTDAEKSGLEDYCKDAEPEDKLFPACYLQTWCMFPRVENLARTGYARYISGLIASCMVQMYPWATAYVRYAPKATGNRVRWKERRPNEMLRLSKDEYRALAGEEFAVVAYFAELKAQYGLSLSPELVGQVREIGPSKLHVLTKDTTHYGLYISPVRIIHYVYKQISRYGDFSPGDLRDHWRILYEFYGRLPEELIFPARFEQAHATFSAQLAGKQNAEQDAGIRLQLERLRWMTWRDDEAGMMIRPAESTAELVFEGKKLHHCVGTYAKSVARGESAIFFIRRTDAPDVPFFTLEYKDGKVAQNRGDHNRDRTPEVKGFEAAWLAHLRELRRQSERRTA